MKNNKNLKKYIDKIKVESIIKSILYGFILGLVFVCLLSFILYLFKTKQVLIVIILGVLITCVSSYFIYQKVFVPSINKVANRIDELGLEERIITMVENEDKDSYIYQKQREDALIKLDNVKTSEIKFKFSKYMFIVLGAVLVLSGFSLTLPDRSSHNSSTNSNSSYVSNSSSISSSTSSSSSELIDEDAIIQEMLDKLREIINKAGIDQDVKDELHAIVDALEEELKNLDTLEEKIQTIKDAQKEIEERIKEELLKMSLGRALQQYDLTKELGIAIYQEDLDKVNIAMNNLIILIQQSSNPIEDARKIMECLNNALDIATKEKNEALIEAVRNFADSLKAIVGDNSQTMSISFNDDYVIINTLNDGDESSSIIEVLETANQEIQDALRKSDETQVPEQGEGEEDEEGEQTEQDVHDAGDQMDSAMDDALEDLEDLLEKESQENQEQEGNQGNEGEPDDEVPPPSFDDSELESDTVIDGDTPYLDVFEEYYEQILEYLANNEDIPDDLREAIEEYLEMIKG